MDERDQLIAAIFAASPWTLDEFLVRYEQSLAHLADREPPRPQAPQRTSWQVPGRFK